MHSPDPDALKRAAPRAEQTFFPDPALDRAMGVVMALATEVYVMRDRQAALERLLARRGALDPSELDAEPTAAEARESQADRDAFVAHLMSSVLGQQASKGATT
ncbi:MAG: hypothetical protein AB7P21_22000 [Lautropia sp.]